MGAEAKKLVAVVTRPRSDVTTIIYITIILCSSKVVTRPRSDVTTINTLSLRELGIAVVTRPRSDVTTIIRAMLTPSWLLL